MKKQIWKFKIEIVERYELQMPTLSEILSVQVDEKTGNVCIWAMVFPTNTPETRYFEVVGTGNDIHYDMGTNKNFIGTFQLHKGQFVGHLFELI